MPDKTITGIVTWLRNWFYDESEVDNLLNSKQNTLVSGTNIKTINNQSLLGQGNISIQGGGSDVVDLIYPVGSIYMSVNSTSPATLFGGTWEQIQDKFLLASGTSYSNGSTGGSADTVVVEHTHILGNEDYYFVGKKKSDSASNKRVTVPTTGSNYAYVSSVASFGNFGSTKSSGESGTGKNMPPYLAVNVWKRTA